MCNGIDTLIVDCNVDYAILVLACAVCLSRTVLNSYVCALPRESFKVFFFFTLRVILFCKFVTLTLQG